MADRPGEELGIEVGQQVLANAPDVAGAEPEAVDHPAEVLGSDRDDHLESAPGRIELAEHLQHGVPGVLVLLRSREREDFLGLVDDQDRRERQQAAISERAGPAGPGPREMRRGAEPGVPGKPPSRPESRPGRSTSDEVPSGRDTGYGRSQASQRACAIWPTGSPVARTNSSDAFESPPPELRKAR